jgi:pilus assembly protein CpaF
VTERLLDEVRARLVATGETPSPAAVARAVRDSGVVLGPDSVLGLARRLHDDLVGTGPLAAVLADPQVSDVVVNGPDNVFVDRGRGLERVDIQFGDTEQVRALAVRLAAAAGRRLDDAAPWVDAALPDGTRLHAVLPPVAPDGPLLSLRVLGRRTPTLDDLLESGTITRSLLPTLVAIVGRRLSYLVTGGTGVGKTTLLGALLSLVPERERIVLVEDTAELQPRHPHAVRLVARMPNVEGAGAVRLDDLVRQAMRMRPDRLVVGEVRGPEVVDMLAALNTGHEGGCATVHANTSHDVPARVEALALATGLNQAAVRTQLEAGVDLVLHVARLDGRRRLAEVAVLRGAGSQLRTELAVVVDPAGRTSRGPALGALHERLGEAPAL